MGFKDITNGIEQASEGEPALKSYVFPSELRDPSFAFRKVIIKIYRNRVVTDMLKSIPGVNPNADLFSNSRANNGRVQYSNKGTEVQGSLLSAFASKDDSKKPSNFDKAISDATSYKYDFPNSEIEFQVTLPIPNQFTESYSHGYSTNNGFISAILNTLAADKIADGAQTVLSHYGMQKVIPNQDKFQNYTGSEPRSFDMVFKIVPNSKEEAIEAAKLIYTLKRNSCPEISAQNLLMLQPKFFTVEFANGVLQKLINPLPCVLRNISCTYDDGSYVSTTIDGMPKVITLSLSFAEVRVKTSNDFSKENQDSGYGVTGVNK